MCGCEGRVGGCRRRALIAGLLVSRTRRVRVCLTNTGQLALEDGWRATLEVGDAKGVDRVCACACARGDEGDGVLVGVDTAAGAAYASRAHLGADAAHGGRGVWRAEGVGGVVLVGVYAAAGTASARRARLGADAAQEDGVVRRVNGGRGVVDAGGRVVWHGG